MNKKKSLLEEQKIKREKKMEKDDDPPPLPPRIASLSHDMSSADDVSSDDVRLDSSDDVMLDSSDGTFIFFCFFFIYKIFLH